MRGQLSTVIYDFIAIIFVVLSFEGKSKDIRNTITTYAIQYDINYGNRYC